MERYYKKNDETLQYDDVTHEITTERGETKIRFFGLISVIVLIMIYYTISAMQLIRVDEKNKELQTIIDTLQKSEHISFNLHHVDKYIESLPFKDKNLVKRQYRLESGNLTSKIARTHKNIFGMKNSRKRPQLGKNGGEYRQYEDWRICVHDRLEWEKSGGRMSAYAEDVNYFQKLSYAE